MFGSNYKKNMMLIAILAALAGMLFGMDTGIISGALPFISKEFHASTQVEEFIVSSVLAGAVIGTLFSGLVARWLGRRRTLLLSSIVFFVASFACAIATSSEFLIAARLFLGTAVGMAAFNAPLYLSEISPFNHRGGVITLYQAMVNLGIVIALVIDLSLTNSGNW